MSMNELGSVEELEIALAYQEEIRQRHSARGALTIRCLDANGGVYLGDPETLIRTANVSSPTSERNSTEGLGYLKPL